MGLPESTWTSPRPDCPHPEYWHAPDEQATEDEVTALVGAMVAALQPDIVVESGTYNGDTAEAIARNLWRNGHGHLWTLEVDRVRAGDAAARLTRSPYGEAVSVIFGSSLVWQPPGPIDFAWIDCDASRRHLVLRAWLPWMHDRTVVGIHDTGPQHPVRELLRPLEDEGLLSLLDLPTPRGVSFARIRR
jgi:predicted O-methyltransferase YrrM